ncbi:MAG: MMPL family transporter [Verrucomicrobiota bacterium]
MKGIERTREDQLPHSILYRWLLLSFRYPVIALTITLIGVAAFALGIRNLTFDPSLEGIIEGDDPATRELEEFNANFGGETHLIVIVESDRLFQRETLASLLELRNELEGVPEIRSIRSILDIPVLQKYTGRNLIAPLRVSFPEEDGVLEGALSLLRSSPLLEGSLLSPQGNATLFQLSFRESQAAPKAKTRGTARVIEIAAEINRSEQEIDIYLLGLPIANEEANAASKHDLLLLSPIAIVLICLLLQILYRSSLAIFLPALTGVLSGLAILGLMGHAGIEMTLLLSPIILLVFVLGCTEDLHFLSSFQEALRRGKQGEELIRFVDSHIGTATLLTALTTVLGFLSVSFVPIVGLKEFALCAATGMFLNFLITITILPSIFSMVSRHGCRVPNSKPFPLFAAVERASLSASHRPRLTFFLFAVTGVLFTVGIFRVEVDSNLLRYLPKDSDTLKNKKRFEESFYGSAIHPVVVDTRTENGVFNRKAYQALESFHDHLEKEGRVVSLIDLINARSTLFSEVHEPSLLKTETRKIASEEELELLKSFLRPQLVDYDASRAVFYFAFNETSSSRLREIKRTIREIASSLFPDDFSLSITGQRMLIGRFCDLLAHQLLVNLCFLTATASLFIAIGIRSVKLGLVALIPNTFPILATFGIMGLCGFSFSVATLPVAIVAFGLAIDDTIHLLSRFRVERTLKLDSNLTERLIKAEIQPIVTTSIAVIAGYLLLCFGEFQLNREVGLLFAWAIFIALLSDLFLTPALLSRYFTSNKPKDTASSVAPADSLQPAREGSS